MQREPDNRGLRANAISGVKWNFIGQVGRQSIAFVVSITLARLVSPSEFGLLAMLFIFQEIANALVNSGLNAPLIQAESITQEDCSTVFYFNVVVAVVCYGLLLAGAPYIAGFYDEPMLNTIIGYYGLVFLIHAFGNVQAGLLLRNLDYRQYNLVSLVGIPASGLVAVVMAFRGYGVYSLLGQHISYALITNALYWRMSKWRPALTFSTASFRTMFGFGSKVLVVSFLDKTLGAIDDLIIGRLRGTAFLGQYSRGKTTRDLPVTQITSIFSSLVFPLFSRIKDPKELLSTQDRFLGVVTYLTAPAMVGMWLLAEPLITVLYSDTWLPAAHYLRLFCLFGITVPLNSILVQVIMSTGEHQRFLELELKKKAVLLVAVVVGAFLGADGLVLALTAGHYLMLVLSFHAVARLTGAAALPMARSILPGVALSLLMALPVYLALRIPWPGDTWELLGCTLVGVASYWGLSALFGSRDYRSAKGLLLARIRGQAQ